MKDLQQTNDITPIHTRMSYSDLGFSEFLKGLTRKGNVYSVFDSEVSPFPSSFGHSLLETYPKQVSIMKIEAPAATPRLTVIQGLSSLSVFLIASIFTVMKKQVITFLVPWKPKSKYKETGSNHCPGPIRRKYFHLFLNKPDFKFSSGHFIAYKVRCLWVLPFPGISRATPWSQLSRYRSEHFFLTPVDRYEGRVESRWIRHGLW